MPKFEMDKLEIVRHLHLINDLLAIEGANPYSTRAHNHATQAILSSSLSIADILSLPPGTIPGVGRETLAMIRSLTTDGSQALMQRLHIHTPVSAAELLHLPGIGPKTAHLLLHQFGINDTAGLSHALTNGQIPHIPGLGPARLARLRRDLHAILAGKDSLPIALAWPLSLQLVGSLEELPGVHRVSVSGAVRRLLVMSHYLELVVSLHKPDEFRSWIQQLGSDIPTSEEDFTCRITVTTQQRSIPVVLHATTPETYPTRLMETTGDETHHAVLTGLLQQKGISWTRLGLLSNQHRIHVQDETQIYRLLQLPYLPPEIREGAGLLCDPSQLISNKDIKGDLHVHSNWSDGALSIEDITRTAEQLGYEYIAITDHSQSLTIAHGLTAQRLTEQRYLIDEIQEHTRVKILHGIEVDILPDGHLDMPDETLFQLDLVIASVHSAMHQPQEQMTQRILQAIRHPAVHIIGHLTGRLLGRRSSYPLDTDTLFEEAAHHAVMFELNANPNRLDISEHLLRQARAAGLLVPVSTDTHQPADFANMAYGVRMARRGWLYKQNVLNALPYDQLQSILNRRRT